MRLGIGEYANAELVAFAARGLFLAAVQRLAPEVLRSLRGDPWRAYRLLRAELTLCRHPAGWAAVTAHYRQRYGDRVALFVHEQNGRTIEGLRWSTVRLAEGDFLPDLLFLKGALTRWAERFNLGEAHLPANDWWTFDDALHTLAVWSLLPKLAEPEQLEWQPSGVAFYHPIRDEEQSFRFVWDPTWETRSAAEARIAAAFKEHLEQYLDRVEALLTHSPEWRRAPEKRNPQHFEWLVRYQVQEWRPSRIAREYLGDGALVNTVWDALEATAAQVGITLRRERRGRPRKQ